jgi:hypothetical protein
LSITRLPPGNARCAEGTCGQGTTRGTRVDTDPYGAFL